MTAMSLTSATTAPARLGSSPDDFARIGVEPRAIKLWEDGMRTDGSRGTFEWWFFDAHLVDGAKLVVVFLTKEMTALKKPLDPSIRIDLTLPDGNSARKIAGFAAETFSASTETCDVRIGDNVFAGDLHTYTIRARVEEIEVEVTLTGQVPAWRPETGYWLFGEQGKHYFAWLPSCRRAGSRRPTRWAATAVPPRASDTTTTTGATPRCSTSCTTGTGRAARPVPIR
jgi:hypothetical protein